MNVHRNKMKRSFVVSKLPEDSELKKEINTCFEDADKYLKINPAMVIGRLIKGPRLDEEFKLVPHSIVGPVSLHEEAQSLKKNSTLMLKYSAKLSNANLPKLKNEEKVKKPNFESIDDFKLKTVYQEYQIMKNKSKDKTNEFMKSLPEHISTRLKFQEQRLKTFQDEEKKFNRMVKFLSKRTKKDEEALLVNKIDERRMKKEINDIMESKMPLEERYGIYNWNISLRRPKNFQGTRTAIINLGNDLSPIWLGIRETIPRTTEIVRKPNSKSTEEFKNFTKNKYLIQTVQTNDSVNLKHLEEIQELEVIFLKFLLFTFIFRFRVKTYLP